MLQSPGGFLGDLVSVLGLGTCGFHPSSALLAVWEAPCRLVLEWPGVGFVERRPSVVPRTPPGGQQGQNAEFIPGHPLKPGSTGCSELSCGENPPWGDGWPKGRKTLHGDGERLPSPEDASETPAPSPTNKYRLPYSWELVSNGRDGSLGRNPLSQPNFPTSWLCNLRLTIVFCLGFTFLICSMGPVEGYKSDFWNSGDWHLPHTLGRAPCMGMEFNSGNSLQGKGYFYSLLWTGKLRLNW